MLPLLIGFRLKQKTTQNKVISLKVDLPCDTHMIIIGPGIAKEQHKTLSLPSIIIRANTYKTKKKKGNKIKDQET